MLYYKFVETGDLLLTRKLSEQLNARRDCFDKSFFLTQNIFSILLTHIRLFQHESCCFSNLTRRIRPDISYC